MENKEERKKFLKVLQGGIPSIKEIKRLLPLQLQEIKCRIKKLEDEDINQDLIKETQDQIEELESKYGKNFKDLYKIQNHEILNLYRMINNKNFIFFIEQAEQIKNNKMKNNSIHLIKDENKKDIGKEPGE